ncbi:MAG: hypothetical protein APR55_07070 [Methanolinea sp. SDB]|nr:MAG: hypothetical protein APR55_07070 [Methanolinea sp. SDB]
MDGITLPLATVIINLLGLPGVIFLIWHFDNRRDQRKEEFRQKELAEREKAVAQILAQYKEDVAGIRKLYENNTRLVKDYNEIYLRQERMFSETLSVVSLNTQAQTRLVEKIQSNTFCPIVRQEKGFENNEYRTGHSQGASGRAETEKDRTGYRDFRQDPRG